MNIVMTLLVRDEEDIVAANLDFHLAMGVDLVLVTDNGSIDGTVEILERYEKSGRVRIFHEPSDDYSQGRWVTRMARVAAREHRADWVINNDADEFWLPIDGDLRSTLSEVPEDVGVVKAERHNFAPLTKLEGPFHQEMIFRRTRSRNPLGKPLPPKVCHRGHPEIEVAQGNHKVSAPGLGSVLDDGRIEILHFPMRTYEQFKNKIVKGGRAYERNRDLPEQVGSTWRRLYEQFERGELHAHFRERALDRSEVDAALANGTLVVDRRLQRFFSEVTGSAVLSTRNDR